MIKKEQRLRKRKEIENVLKLGQSFYNQRFVLKFLENNFKKNRLCVVVSTKISKKAVVRNKIRRRIKAIFQAYQQDKQNKEKNFDLVVLVKKDFSLEEDFLVLKKLLFSFFDKISK